MTRSTTHRKKKEKTLRLTEASDLPKVVRPASDRTDIGTHSLLSPGLHLFQHVRGAPL